MSRCYNCFHHTIAALVTVRAMQTVALIVRVKNKHRLYIVIPHTVIPSKSLFVELLVDSQSFLYRIVAHTVAHIVAHFGFESKETVDFECQQLAEHKVSQVQVRNVRLTDLHDALFE